MRTRLSKGARVSLPVSWAAGVPGHPARKPATGPNHEQAGIAYNPRQGLRQLGWLHREECSFPGAPPPRLPHSPQLPAQVKQDLWEPGICLKARPQCEAASTGRAPNVLHPRPWQASCQSRRPLAALDIVTWHSAPSHSWADHGHQASPARVLVKGVCLYCSLG